MQKCFSVFRLLSDKYFDPPISKITICENSPMGWLGKCAYLPVVGESRHVQLHVVLITWGSSDRE